MDSQSKQELDFKFYFLKYKQRNTIIQLHPYNNTYTTTPITRSKRETRTPSNTQVWQLSRNILIAEAVSLKVYSSPDIIINQKNEHQGPAMHRTQMTREIRHGSSYELSSQ